MERQVQDMLKKGVIRESNSPWSAWAILVPKRSLDGKPKYRFCVDFPALNAITKFDSYPLPRFDETTASLHGSRYFTVLDCHSGFWQVNIKEEHKERTGFTVPSGHYKFNHLPFGLANIPLIFKGRWTPFWKIWSGQNAIHKMMTSLYFPALQKNTCWDWAIYCVGSTKRTCNYTLASKPSQNRKCNT
jgi:hypothetical protein